MIVDSAAVIGFVLREPDRLHGDCFAYVLAKERREPLLFTGTSFAQSNIEPALEA